MWQEFKTFALHGNSLDLAVGVVIGGAFTAIVNALVNYIVLPPFGALLGGVKFSSLTLSLGGKAVPPYGLFVQAVVNFAAVAFGLFVIVKFINRFLGGRARTQTSVAPSPKSQELVVLEEIRDSLRGQKS